MQNQNCGAYRQLFALDWQRLQLLKVGLELCVPMRGLITQNLSKA